MAASASDGAQARVIQAISRAESAADAAIPLLIARRVDETNRLSQALVNTLGALRQAAPTTREVDANALAQAIDMLAIADQYYDAAERASFRKTSAQRDFMIAAGGVLDAADATLRSCDESRCFDADVAYAVVFERYDQFREQAERLSTAGADDPLGTWVLCDAPTPDYSARMMNAAAGPFATRGREVRAVARALASAQAADCVSALDHLPAQGDLPESCVDAPEPSAPIDVDREAETADTVAANPVDLGGYAQ